MPESKQSLSRLDNLLAKLIEETIEREELEELEAHLDGDPEAQRRYLHYLALHSDLEEDSGTGAHISAALSSRGRWQFAAFIGAAAAVVVLALTLMFQERPESPIARLVELSGPIAWRQDGSDEIRHLRDPNVGDVLSAGTLESFSAGSWAKIEFSDGTILELSGHSVLRMSEKDRGKLIQLRKGELSLNVTAQPSGKPMRLVTPSAEVEVLGTQFNVIASSFSTQVMVNEGIVHVTRLADGRTERVSADHLIVAALERDNEFKALPRQPYVETWESNLPLGIGFGEWKPEKEKGQGSLRARPRFWPIEGQQPVLLYSTVVHPLRSPAASPVRISEDSRLRIRGRVESSHRVMFGMTTNHLKGGFSGKFETSREIKVEDLEGQEFEVELPIGEFRSLSIRNWSPRERQSARQLNSVPASPIGHALFNCWTHTLEKDVGLEVFSIELLE